MTLQPAIHDNTIGDANHKDRLPGETVALIETILDNIGIVGMQELRFNPVAGCHSMRITSPSYPLWGANGKGMTEAYCRASAYAEYLERLQCMSSRLFGKEGAMYPRQPIFHDEVERPVAEIWHESTGVMRELVENEAAITVDTLPCLPFWDVDQGKNRLLPYEFMLLVTASTGMSAGNTPEESLAQGVCEVMERYAARLVVERKLQAPAIPFSALPPLSRGLQRIIEALRQRGFKLIVKDCTMGGVIPVLAAIVIDEASDRFGLSYGCDPVFEVALQRCISELYQGCTELKHCFSHWAKDVPPVKNFFNNVHSSLAPLLCDAPPALFQNAFVAAGQTNREYLDFLLHLIGQRGLSLYVRDFSFLGFPIHYVFIEKMSSPQPLTAEECRFYYHGVDKARHVIFRIDQADASELSGLAGIFADKIHSETIFSPNLLSLLNMPVYGIPLMNWIGPGIFTVFIFIESGRLDDALCLLDESKHEMVPETIATVKAILATYCRLAKRRKSSGAILSQLQAKFGDGPYGPGLPHLLNKKYASFFLREPADAQGDKFSRLPMPRCLSPFSCLGCQCKGRCSWKRIPVIREKIKQAYRPVDQTRLGKIFSNGRSCI